MGYLIQTDTKCLPETGYNWKTNYNNTSFGTQNKKSQAFSICYLIVLRLAGRYATVIRLDGADFSLSLYDKLLICLDCAVDFRLNFLVCWANLTFVKIVASTA